MRASVAKVTKKDNSKLHNVAPKHIPALRDRIITKIGNQHIAPTQEYKFSAWDVQQEIHFERVESPERIALYSGHEKMKIQPECNSALYTTVLTVSGLSQLRTPRFSRAMFTNVFPPDGVCSNCDSCMMSEIG